MSNATAATGSVTGAAAMPLTVRSGFGTMVRTLAVVAVTAAMLVFSGCAGPGSGGSASGEQFVDGGTQSGAHDWKTIAAAITADGKVSRTETEQAIEDYYQCLADNGFHGTYAVDLDISFWTLGIGSTALNTDVEGYRPLPERFRKDTFTEEDSAAWTQWMHSDEGKATLAATDRLFKERETPCKPFEEVRDLASSQADWAWYDRNEFDAIQRCIAANAPTYAERAQRVQYRFTDTMQGTSLLSEEFYGTSGEHWFDFVSQPESSEAFKLSRCFDNPNGVPIRHFGTDASLHGMAAGTP